MKKATTTIEAKTKEIIKKYNRDKSSVIAVLQDIQEQYNYLPKDALTTVNEEMEIPASRIYEVATFYNSFSLTPRGEHVVKLCMGTACHVRGAAAILDKLERTLGIKPGEKVHVLQYENRIEYIPVKPIKKMRGFLKGIDTTILREKDRI